MDFKIYAVLSARKIGNANNFTQLFFSLLQHKHTVENAVYFVMEMQLIIGLRAKFAEYLINFQSNPLRHLHNPYGE